MGYEVQKPIYSFPGLKFSIMLSWTCGDYNFASLLVYRKCVNLSFLGGLGGKVFLS